MAKASPNVSGLPIQFLNMNIIPIIIGGGQDTTFSNYKAYDQLEQTVNLVVVDSKFAIRHPKVVFFLPKKID